MMKPVLFRADGSRRLGMGHIMRCLALAEDLNLKGVSPLFATRDYDSDVTGIIQHYGGVVEIVPGDADFKNDLRITLEIIKKHGTKLIITDLSNVDILGHPVEYIEYLGGLKTESGFLITIDDLNVLKFPSDIVINANCGAEKIDYSLSDGNKYLLGPDYFIFRQEFIKVATAEKVINRVAGNILVTMGGSDQLSLNLKVARALTGLGEISPLSVRIVLGLDEAEEFELKGILGDFTGKYELIQNTDSMASLMQWADLAIIAGGLTKYEAAVTGTPAIIISQVAHQASLAEDFEKEGTALNLGFGTMVSEDQICEAVSGLLKDFSSRTRMSKRGKELVDGRGIERIIAEIPGEVFL